MDEGLEAGSNFCACTSLPASSCLFKEGMEGAGILKSAGLCFAACSAALGEEIEDKGGEDSGGEGGIFGGMIEDGF